MADDVPITAGSGTTIATDDAAGRHIQLFKLAYSADGVATLVQVDANGVLVNTELPAAAALSDTTGNPTAPMVGGATMVWDGTNWTRARQTDNSGASTGTTGVPITGIALSNLASNSIPWVSTAAGDAVSAAFVASAGVYVYNGSTLDRVRGDTTNGMDVDVTRQPKAATATLADVAGSASSVTLQASNTARLGWTCYNDSTAGLYVKFGTTASATSFTVFLGPTAYYELPEPIYTGRIDGIWTAAAGNARVTELT